MEAELHYYREIIWRLLDHAAGKDTLERLEVRSQRLRHIYLVEPNEAHRLYFLLDCLNIPYYRGPLKPEGVEAEILEKLDERRLAVLKDLVPISYVGLREVAQPSVI